MLGITVLGSGSRGNSLIVHGSGSSLLVDVGFSLREFRRRLEIAGIDEGCLRAVLVSHEHSDHVKGLRVVSQQLNLPVYCNRGTGEMIRDRGLSPERLSLFAAGTPFTIDEFTIEPFSIPHDAIDPMGFIIRNATSKIGIVTDLGHVGSMVCHHLRECDILVVESNHEIELVHQSSRPWSLKQRIIGRHGHLSNTASMELIRKVLHSRTRHLILAHASQDCNCYKLVKSYAEKNLLEMGRADVTAQVAQQNEVLPTVWIE